MSSSSYIITQNEVARLSKNMIVWAIAVIVLLVAYLNGVGMHHELLASESYGEVVDNVSFFLNGYAETWSDSMAICCVMAAFIGISSISEERVKSTFNVLLVKPLYRRDVLIGKLVGIGVFILGFVILSILFITLALVLNLGEPVPIDQLFTRLIVYALSLTLACLLIAGISMLVGIVCKNIIGAFSIVTTYVYVDWFSGMTDYLGNISMITPHELYSNMFFGLQYINLFSVSISVNDWILSVIPRASLMIVELMVVLALGVLVFTRMDDV